MEMKLQLCRRLLPLLLLSVLCGWFLTERDGRVTVLNADGSLCQQTDMPVDLLPAGDAAAIRAGFYCADEAELSRALENFCS